MRKIAVSQDMIRRVVGQAAQKVSPERLGRFAGRVERRSADIMRRGDAGQIGHYEKLEAARGRAAIESAPWSGRQKLQYEQGRSMFKPTMMHQPGAPQRTMPGKRIGAAGSDANATANLGPAKPAPAGATANLGPKQPTSTAAEPVNAHTATQAMPTASQPAAVAAAPAPTAAKPAAGKPAASGGGGMKQWVRKNPGLALGATAGVSAGAGGVIAGSRRDRSPAPAGMPGMAWQPQAMSMAKMAAAFADELLKIEAARRV